MLNITDLIPFIGKPVWVQVDGYATDVPKAEHYDEGILVSVLADDMGAWVIVRWDEGLSVDPDRVGVKYPWFRAQVEIPRVVDEAIHGCYDDEPFDPENDYDERYNYVFGSSATGITQQA